MSLLSAFRWQFSASRYIFNQKSSVTYSLFVTPRTNVICIFYTWSKFDGFLLCLIDFDCSFSVLYMIFIFEVHLKRGVDLSVCPKCDTTRIKITPWNTNAFHKNNAIWQNFTKCTSLIWYSSNKNTINTVVISNTEPEVRRQKHPWSAFPFSTVIFARIFT